MSETSTHEDLGASFAARARAIVEREAARQRGLPLRHAAQASHLTVPATVWKYVEGAVTKSAAKLVMIDLEDSIPRGDDALLRAGRANVVRALRELDWGPRLRFFRPRGLELDPSMDDLRVVVGAAGARLEGVVLPKVEHPDEVSLVSELLDELERRGGLEPGSIRLQILIESAAAKKRAFEIAQASPRVVGLVFGAFDYMSSLRMAGVPYRYDHPAVDEARIAIVEAAASVGVAAIAEMTLNYPTRDKSPEEQRAALDECRRDAEHARQLGMVGKWVGIPAQVEVANEVFSPSRDAVDHAVRYLRIFLEAERSGRGAVMIDGKMGDRATARLHETMVAVAKAHGLVDDALARELGVV